MDQKIINRPSTTTEANGAADTVEIAVVYTRRSPVLMMDDSHK